MITELFAAIAAYAEKRGVVDIGSMAGCWEFTPADGWFVAVNGHGEPIKCSKATDVPPFTAYVEWNGFPAGLISPHDGVLAAGAKANEAALLKALEWEGF